MRRHILCLGDSNTHGYCADPGGCEDGPLLRFSERERWTCLLQEALGPEYLVIEEGLPGRTTVFDDPVCPGLRGLDYLIPCLKSHEPVSLLLLMLGTNDTKERFSANACTITKGMERLIRTAMQTDCWGPGGTPRILLMAPPVIGRGVYASPVAMEMGAGCAEKSLALPGLYRALAASLDCSFLDANQAGAVCNEVDFMHLTAQGHRNLARALAGLIPGLLP